MTIPRPPHSDPEMEKALDRLWLEYCSRIADEMRKAKAEWRRKYIS